jgi:hypothetical protein
MSYKISHELYLSLYYFDDVSHGNTFLLNYIVRLSSVTCQNTCKKTEICACSVA